MCEGNKGIMATRQSSTDEGTAGNTCILFFYVKLVLLRIETVMGYVSILAMTP